MTDRLPPTPDNRYNLEGYEAFVRFLKQNSDVLDRLLSLWNAFDLNGLLDFLNHLDLERPYAPPRLSHKRYLENRALIQGIIQDDPYPPPGTEPPGYLNRELVKHAYSADPAQYDAVWDHVWSYEDRDRVIQALQLAPGEHLLEVGVGTGNNLKNIPLGCRVTGIDFSAAMLSRCRQKIQAMNLDHVELVEMDAHRLEFDDHSFDKALFFYTLCCVEDPSRVLAEAARVLHPGGAVVVFDVVRSDIPEVALLQYLYRPIARELGAIYLEFCPPRNITYDSYFDLEQAIRRSGLLTGQASFLDPFHSVILGVYRRTEEG